MTQRRKVWLTTVIILVITVLAVLVDVPKGPDIHMSSLSRELKVRLGLDLQGGTSLTYEADVSHVGDADKEESMAGLRDVVERRVNQFGVSEPVVRVSRVGDSQRLIVELPGITDVNAAIQEIGETPLLEFREEEAPKEKTEEEKVQIRTKNEEQRVKAEDVLQKALTEGADFSALAQEFSEDPGSKDKGGDLDFAGKGLFDPAFEEALFSEEATVGQVIPRLVESSFGYHIIKITDKREVNAAADAVGDSAEPGGIQPEVRASHILLLTESEETQPPLYPNYVNTGLNGEHLVKAQVGFSGNGTAGGINEPQVQLNFNEEGKKLFAEITERNINKTVAIYLDGTPISTPVVNAAIPTGEAVITGSFTVDEAKELARRLNAGALPVPISLVNQENVGPSLGEISLQTSLFAGIIGLVALSLFMIVYYRLPGLVAVIALLIYSLITLALFKLIPVTLSLAGIAGFVLSIGMAVDANVLIFERLKEEFRSGKPLVSSIEDGFARAWPSIRDSNLSSLITCFILGTFSTSLIKGFAITLALGIGVSMFSAITITRTFMRIIAIWLPEKHVKILFGVEKIHQK
ncbi:MAG: protein-export membrane protein SecD [Candidatus Kerfeldbacteria bacterium RIFCSPHIGHO2_12_FULL_48_17]|uniref:Protein translocase subunit SecD n=1 Tax=Candidatus Kerfeldbacteria bacterium RIFCSPHIGHO2_12_FULL_48_17 TaxID=1798542 RepID=A0A1G2AY85_9BACT|nr:MAG: protein-export membrane protein SecD [Candidatus Kerfeldbacteria bacterium RIFCSPHIGHO2_12_FULL_48_17]